MGECHLVEVSSGVVGQSDIAQADALTCGGRGDAEGVPRGVDLLAVLRYGDVGLVGERVADRTGSVGLGSRCTPVGDIAADSQNGIGD